MNLDTVVVSGLPAWLPNRGAEGLDALHVHDFPLIGTFQISGETVLFACITGATSRRSVWGYTVLDAAGIRDAAEGEFDTTEDLEEWARDQFVGKTGVFALVRECEIHHWSTEDVTEEGVLDAAIRFMDTELAAMQSANPKQGTAQRKAAQARADATLSVLEPA